MSMAECALFDRTETNHPLCEALAGQEGPMAVMRSCRMHTSTVYVLCLRLVQDAVRARAILEDAFVALWSRMRQNPGAPGCPGRQLRRLAMDLALSHLRRCCSPELEPRQLQALLRELQRSSAEMDLAREQALALLPDTIRTIVLLREIEGLDCEVTASLLGMPQGVVETLLDRSRTLGQALVA